MICLHATTKDKFCLALAVEAPAGRGGWPVVWEAWLGLWLHAARQADWGGQLAWSSAWLGGRLVRNDLKHLWSYGHNLLYIYKSVSLLVGVFGEHVRRELTCSSVPMYLPCVVVGCCSSTQTSQLEYGHKTSWEGKSAAARGYVLWSDQPSPMILFLRRAWSCRYVFFTFATSLCRWWSCSALGWAGAVESPVTYLNYCHAIGARVRWDWLSAGLTAVTDLDIPVRVF